MLREQFIAILVAEGISAPNADGIWKCRPEFMPAVDLTEEDVRATARALIKEFPEYGPYQEGRAAEFAARAHATQKRKYSDEPYIVHPCAVVQIARPFVTEDGLCAAWLHDVVEDCGIQLDRIRSEFGKRVCEIVSGLTSWTKHPDAPEADRLGNRAERKARDLEFLSKQDAETQTIKVADLLDNSWSIVDNDPEFSRVYLPEKAALLRAMPLAHETLRNEAFVVLKESAIRLGINL